MLTRVGTLPFVVAFETRPQDTKERGSHCRLFALWLEVLFRVLLRALCCGASKRSERGKKVEIRTRKRLLYAYIFLLATGRDQEKRVEDVVHARYIAQRVSGR